MWIEEDIEQLQMSQSGTLSTQPSLYQDQGGYWAPLGVIR